jgi:predicted outer membrane repeat protein
MSASICLRLLSLPLVAAFLFNPAIGQACTATAPDAFTVGNTAADATCNYDTIQAAIDAATCPAGTKIIITPERSYDAQHLSITNKNISLIGRGTAPHCNTPQAVCGGIFPCPTNPLGTLNGGNNSVLTVRGNSNVLVQYLTITGGNHGGGGSGGGIDYDGTGTLTLDTSTVSDNTAGYGGGINVKGSGGPAELHINQRTLIIGNTATTSGGGIRIEGETTMTMNAPNTWVALNEATSGYGGGVEILNHATANIGSPGYLNAAAIYDNTAKYGGGIAVTADAFLYLYTTDPLHPVGIDNNTAFNTGGGIYISPLNPSGSDICAANFRITNNIAQEGTGLYADVDSNGDGTQIFLNSNIFGCADKLVSLGGVACDASQQCNIVHGNVAMAVTNNNQPTNGAALLLQSGTFLTGTKLDVRDNHGGYALRELGNTIVPVFYTDVALSNCLFADNAVSHELILASDGNSHLNLYNCTFAHDTIGASRVIAANDVLGLNDSIIDEGSQIDVIAFSGSGGNLTAQYNIAGDTTGFPAGLTNMQGRPTFVDVAHGDYRLFYGIQGGSLVKSLGIDYAPPANGVDIRGLPRDQAIYSPMYGVRDLGAYEMQGVGDRIFVDTFGDSVLLVH